MMKKKPTNDNPDCIYKLVLQKYGTKFISEYLSLLINDTIQEETLIFRNICLLQSKRYQLPNNGFLKSRKREVVLSRHVVIYVLHSEHQWPIYLLKKLFRISREEWIEEVIENISSQLQSKYHETPTEHQKIATSIEKIIQTFTTKDNYGNG